MTRRFVLVLLLALWTPVIVGAADLYWAFGDSITRGGFFDPDYPGAISCVINPPAYPVKCGYQGRLQDNLGKTVLNRGEPGETTAGGKSRIGNAGEPLASNRCSDPDAGDVLLLMEGTNDISLGVSTTSIKANLADMVSLATEQCVDTAIAQTIRRLLSSAPTGSTTGDPDHPATLALAIAVAQLAAAEKRAYVAIWGTLCPEQPCFDFHYWGKLNGGDPGHIDSSGYDQMEPLFRARINFRPAAGQVGNLSPTGTIIDTMPTFTWNEWDTTAFGFDWYFLEVDGGASHGLWYPEEAICSAGACSVTPGDVLASGSHDWRVRTRNLRGVGLWTSLQSFTVGTPPGPAVPVSPSGDLCDATPEYSWSEAAGATHYDLEVEDSQGGVTPLGPYDAASACSLGMCAVTGPTLGADDYSWRVRGTNSAGDGPWSAMLDFTLYPMNLTVDNTTPPPFRACQKVSTAASGFTVESVDTVIFHAGSSVELGNDFQILSGGDFTARVDG